MNRGHQLVHRHAHRPSIPGPMLHRGSARARAASHSRDPAIHAWDAPVDPATAVLLTSELMTNAIRHECGETVILAITCACRQFRVDVHDTSCSVPVDGSAGAETGRGLMLVASLSSDWSCYPTAAGKAVTFTLAF